MSKRQAAINICFRSIYVGMLVFLVSCTVGGPSSINTIPETTTAVIKVPTQSSTPFQTETTIAQATISAITPTSTPMLTPTLAPTLNPQQRDTHLTEWLRTNGGCELPCFWGITPGQTTQVDMHSFFQHHNLKFSSFPRENQGVTVYSSFELNTPSQVIRGNLDLYEETGRIKIIWFGASDLSQAPYYSMKNIFSVLGEPSEVEIDLGLSSPERKPETVFYELVVSYLDYERPQIRLSYGGHAIRNGDEYLFCPNDLHLKKFGRNSDGSGFEVLIQPVENRMSLKQISMAYGGVVISQPPRIEDAAGVKTGDFYQQILKGDESVCFGTPIQFWAVP